MGLKNKICYSWTYATASELEGRGFWGRISTYEGGGFTQLLSPDRKGVTKSLIADLKVICVVTDIFHLVS